MGCTATGLPPASTLISCCPAVVTIYAACTIICLSYQHYHDFRVNQGARVWKQTRCNYEKVQPCPKTHRMTVFKTRVCVAGNFWLLAAFLCSARHANGRRCNLYMGQVCSASVGRMHTGLPTLYRPLPMSETLPVTKARLSPAALATWTLTSSPPAVCRFPNLSRVENLEAGRLSSLRLAEACPFA